MPRDDDDYDRPPKPRSSLLWLWILLGLGGAGAALFVVAMAFFFAFFVGRPVTTRPPSGALSSAAPVVTESSSATMTRDEFKANVMGKTPEEVLAAVGKPDKTTENGSETTWDYGRRTIDPATGKSGNAQVVLEKGRVDHVNFD